MVRATDEEALAALIANNASFYHAINLRDFVAYCQTDRLMTRADLRATGNLTPFESDLSDEAKGLFDHQFGNLSDFGAIYWNSKKGVAIPNVYGPITIEWPATALAGCTDLAVSITNAWSAEYDRAASLSFSDLHDSFENRDAGWLKSSRGHLEVSFRHAGLRVSAARGIWVEPVEHGVSLAAEVGRSAPRGVPIRQRDTERHEEKLWRLRQLVDWADGAASRQGELPFPDGIAEWCGGLSQTNGQNLRRWARTTDQGTLQLLWGHPDNPHTALAEEMLRDIGRP